MSLIPGARVGPYEILSKLGEGGMGEVYRARDTNLGRDVALKVLPESFAADADRVARFKREAQVLASLNHPNIAAIYGVEANTLVMELVAGEDLSALIGRSALPLPDTLAIARQIADALEAAHEQGIVHRDLKPQNIKVRDDGTVKVLDFGLAKIAEATEGSGGRADLANSPTLTNRATQLGMILGTAAYMAPEQARGKLVDKRADIWAFGVVLYEMLTGRRAFGPSRASGSSRASSRDDDESVSDVLAAVLRQDIDWSALPPETPARLRQLLERCLDRDVKTRLRDIGEARVALASPGNEGTPATGAPAATHDRRGVSMAIAATGAIAAAVISAIVVVSLRPTTPPAPESSVVRLPFEAPADVVSEVSDATISPDGKTMLFSGRGADGRRVLWIRRLDSTEAAPLPDTDDPLEPFWSWDSKSIAFGAQGKLKRLDIGSKRAQILADAPRSNNGTWSRANVIVYCPDFGAQLYKIAADGRGGREQVTFGTGNHRYPVFLPDGKHFLYSQNGSVFLASLDSKDTRELLKTGPAIYAPGRSQDAGWLLYVRDGVIVAHAFDIGRLELSGEPVPIAPAETATDWPRGARFSVSTTGVLAIARPATYDYQLAWFDRTGKPAGTLGDVKNVDVAHLPRISPDGTRVIVQVMDSKTRNQDFWVSEIARGTFERLTSTTQLEQLAAWMPDSRSVMAATNRPEKGPGIFRLSVVGSIEEQIAAGTIFPADVTSDGRWLLYTQRGQSTRADVWVLPLTDGNPAAGAKPEAILNSEFEETGPHVSKDGRWLVYGSDATGTPEIYVRPFRDGRVGPQVKVATGHGIMPRWSRDGHTLFFVSAPQGTLSAQMMSVAVTPDGDTLRFGAATPLFNARMLPISTISAGDYDITADGKFLVGTVVGPVKGTAGTIVLNWPAIAGK